MKGPAILAIAASLFACTALAQRLPADLPPGDIPPALATVDAELVANNCAACHSLDYITTQPPGKGEQFWRDSVTKMITVYGAPISPDDAAEIAAILASKFR